MISSPKNWILAILFLILCVVFRGIFNLEGNALPQPAETGETSSASRSPHLPDLQLNRDTLPQRNQPRGTHTIGHPLTTGLLHGAPNLLGQQTTVAQQGSHPPTLLHPDAVPSCKDDPPCRHQQGLPTRCQHQQGHRVNEGVSTNQQDHRVNDVARGTQQDHRVNNGASTSQQGHRENEGEWVNQQGHRVNDGASTSADATRCENEILAVDDGPQWLNWSAAESSVLTMRTRSGRKYNA